MTQRWTIRFVGLLTYETGDTPRPAEIETIVDAVVEELEKLKADDIAVSTNLETGRVEIRISVGEEGIDAAQNLGAGIIRSAFHAAETHTAQWDVDWIEAEAALQTQELVKA